ncbi:hypothetical protein [Alloactinosynnema sp. L-07]|nr:hypothetical protein [Alloactinosynnema sp. L-07]
MGAGAIGGDGAHAGLAGLAGARVGASAVGAHGGQAGLAGTWLDAGGDGADAGLAGLAGARVGAGVAGVAVRRARSVEAGLAGTGAWSRNRVSARRVKRPGRVVLGERGAVAAMRVVGSWETVLACGPEPRTRGPRRRVLGESGVDRLPAGVATVADRPRSARYGLLTSAAAVAHRPCAELASGGAVAERSWSAGLPADGAAVAHRPRCAGGRMLTRVGGFAERSAFVRRPGAGGRLLSAVVGAVAHRARCAEGRMLTGVGAVAERSGSAVVHRPGVGRLLLMCVGTVDHRTRCAGDRLVAGVGAVAHRAWCAGQRAWA